MLYSKPEIQLDDLVVKITHRFLLGLITLYSIQLFVLFKHL
jgi:hypothetical protein